jgi:hypothetical protein
MQTLATKTPSTRATMLRKRKPMTGLTDTPAGAVGEAEAAAAEPVARGGMCRFLGPCLSC